jgi:hypothetical protein
LLWRAHLSQLSSNTLEKDKQLSNSLSLPLPRSLLRSHQKSISTLRYLVLSYLRGK